MGGKVSCRIRRPLADKQCQGSLAFGLRKAIGELEDPVTEEAPAQYPKSPITGAREVPDFLDPLN